ncbi:hypothetical protein PPO43_08860 [Saprospira sp. CCB-QB6]|uniref:hypothetical protein n=1 Tax=Saprospira sp. CCB-QB6 TaxID=3023936 RepID=UPI00234B8B38|nr:hypothetical protein [Saprospira sp. CCB-QB6]WCL80085.1 hypothetical protein PPO43_08860 [Saprospira sp. CCB-QB6]
MRLLLLFCGLFFFGQLGAQTLSQLDSLQQQQLRQSDCYVLADSILLDSLWVLPGSLHWRGQPLADSLYRLQGSYFFPKGALLQQDSLCLSYKRLPLPIHRRRERKDRRLLQPQMQLGEDIVLGQSYGYQVQRQGGKEGDLKGLDYNGSFARGISLGNQQDLILNSSFNLQLAGEVGGVEITGALSDNNIPVQPEGNSQELQDFDRVFIQFKVDEHYLLAGDYDLEQPKNSYFLNHFKRLQGGQFGSSGQLKSGAKWGGQGSFAISRGTFARNSFMGQEGNQGPYRLEGNDGEQLLIILAGSERVFIDGQQLERGSDKDYTIDYNLGEIQFTNKVLITKDKRIQVEFSYSDLEYLRSISAINGHYEDKKWGLRFFHYQEQDAKNQPTNPLSDSAQASLSRAGDQTAQIWGGQSINEADGLSGLVAYQLIDSIVNGINYDSVLVYASSNASDSNFYSVSFRAVSQGGDYIREEGQINGSVYIWIAPDPITGQSRGQYAPLRLLKAPEKKQLSEISSYYNFGKTGQLMANLAISQEDLNRFSNIDNEDNQGVALRLSYQQELSLGYRLKVDSQRVDTLRRSLGINAHYEQLSANFKTIEPYRNREFSRDWGLDSSSSQEQLFWLGLNAQQQGLGNISYKLSGLLRDSSQNWQQSANLQLQHKGWELTGQGSYLSQSNSQFWRPRLQLGYRFQKGLRISAYYEEENKQQRINTDSLAANSFQYQLYRFSAELPTTEQFSLKLSASQRLDRLPLGENLLDVTLAQEAQLQGHWQLGAKENLSFNLNYRKLMVLDSSLSSQDPKNTYLGRIAYDAQWRKGLIKWQTIYELGAGQEQKYAYNYLEVDIGQGTHVWIDRNENSIQEQDEFEEAPFQDQANFIQLRVLTGEFVRANQLAFNQSIEIDPARLWRAAKTGPKSWLKKISSRSIFKLERKTLAQEELAAFNPFELDIADSSLLSISSNMSNALYWDRRGRKFRLILQQSDSRSKRLLNLGFDSQRKTSYSFSSWWQIKPFLRFETESNLAQNENRSDFYSQRNYLLDSWELIPKLSYLRGSDLRLSLNYRQKDSENRLGIEKAQLQELGLEGKWFSSKGKRRNIRLKLSWVELQYEGEQNSPSQFALTEGLQAGSNFLWTLEVQQALSKFLQLSLSYEGRKTGEAQMVHLGRMQLRAIF